MQFTKNIDTLKLSLYNSLFCLVILFFNSCQENGAPIQGKIYTDMIASHIDSSIHPGDDFFQYANGAWFAENKIPESENGWGIFNLVDNENYDRLKKICEDASSMHSNKGHPQQLIGDFFYAGMDTTAIEKNGIQALQKLIDSTFAAKNVPQLLQTAMFLHSYQISSFFDISVYQDMKNSDRYALYFSQGGLGLPDRDYYFNNDIHTQNIRAQYIDCIKQILLLYTKDSAISKQKAIDIFALEKNIASLHKPLQELRDPYANYFAYNMKKLQSEFTLFNFQHSLSQWNITLDSVIVQQPLYFKQLQNLLAQNKLELLQYYCLWHILKNYAPYLNSDYDNIHFRFYSTALQGIQKKRPRWKRVLDVEENALGDALGQLYVKEYFNEKTKKRYENLVDEIALSYEQHIIENDWMTDSTKQKAIVKLKSIHKKVGYPSKWKDYSNMEIDNQSYSKNVMNANNWHFLYSLSLLTKPVDKTLWDITPQTYNAYYNPSNNEIVLPAAIFTAPGYKDEELDDAVIYGYVGASTIGHEITHGFDDEGRKFDEKGNLKNWWSKADEIAFEKKAALLVKQFNEYVVLDSLHPNGKACLGENIADLGGLVIALDAFKKTKQYKENKKIGGLTPLQRYFLGYAYGWMQNKRPEALAHQLLTDVHAPIFLRVIAPMSNCNDWYNAFNVTEKHKSYRPDSLRIKIW